MNDLPNEIGDVEILERKGRRIALEPRVFEDVPDELIESFGLPLHTIELIERGRRFLARSPIAISMRASGERSSCEISRSRRWRAAMRAPSRSAMESNSRPSTPSSSLRFVTSGPARASRLPDESV